jgi:hypothetical protein
MGQCVREEEGVSVMMVMVMMVMMVMMMIMFMGNLPCLM